MFIYSTKHCCVFLFGVSISYIFNVSYKFISYTFSNKRKEDKNVRKKNKEKRQTVRKDKQCNKKNKKINIRYII